MLKPEVESLVPSQSFDRRAFVKTALGSAFAGFLAAAVCTLEEAVVLLFVAKAKLG